MKINGLVLMLISAFIMFSQSLAAETLRLSSPVPEGHIFYKVLTKFSEDLRSRSNGDLDVQIFPSGELGGDSENAIMLETGIIQFSVIPVAFIANQEESLNAWFLPGLFNNVEEAAKAAQLPAAKKMLLGLESQGMVGVGYVFAGMRSLLSVDPIENIGDVKGKTLAAFPIPMFTEWWLTFGAVPTAVAMPEIPAALAANIIDVIDLDLDLIMALKLYEQANYLAVTNHMGFPAIMVASKVWWDGLSIKDRNLIQDVFSEAKDWGVKEQLMADERNLGILKNLGVSITQIDQVEYADNASEIIEKYVSKNSRIGDFYEQAKAQK